MRFRNAELMMASLNKIIKRCRQSGDVKPRVLGVKKILATISYRRAYI